MIRPLLIKTLDSVFQGVERNVNVCVKYVIHIHKVTPKYTAGCDRKKWVGYCVVSGQNINLQLQLEML